MFGSELVSLWIWDSYVISMKLSSFLKQRRSRLQGLGIRFHWADSDLMLHVFQKTYIEPRHGSSMKCFNKKINIIEMHAHRHQNLWDWAQILQASALKDGKPFKDG